jgi:hypothetical protein
MTCKHLENFSIFVITSWREEKKWTKEKNVIEDKPPIWVKVGKKEPRSVWIVLKPCFLKTWKITMKTLYIKKMFYFKNKFLYFQSCNYKVFMKIHHVSRVLLYIESIQEKHVDRWFLYIKSLFPLSNVHQIISVFLWILIYSTTKDPCVQNIQKTKFYLFFSFWMSFNTIIILNM